jgi:hypothetical protein
MFTKPLDASTFLYLRKKYLKWWALQFPNRECWNIDIRSLKCQLRHHIEVVVNVGPMIHYVIAIVSYWRDSNVCQADCSLIDCVNKEKPTTYTKLYIQWRKMFNQSS